MNGYNSVTVSVWTLDMIRKRDMFFIVGVHVLGAARIHRAKALPVTLLLRPVTKAINLSCMENKCNTEMLETHQC